MNDQKTENVLTLTKIAAKKVKELSKQDGKEGYGLKFFVYPGGCSGLQYGMDFAKEGEKTDITMEQNGVKIFLDKESADFINASSLNILDWLCIRSNGIGRKG